MNDQTKKILEKILQTETAWDKETRELRYEVVLATLADYRVYLFMEEVTYPLFNRYTSLMRAMLPSDEEREKHFFWEPHLWGQDKGGWILTQCSEECPADDVSEDISNSVDYRSARIWEQDEKWEYDRPTKEEILALGISPTMVPKKTYKDGAVQQALF